MNFLTDLDMALSSLVIFRELLSDPVFINLSALLSAENENEKARIGICAKFAHSVFSCGENLTDVIWSKISRDENFYLLKRAASLPVSDSLERQLDRELEILMAAASLKTDEAKKLLCCNADLPQWQNKTIDFKTEYRQKMDNINVNGYGIFAESLMFLYEDGKFVPVTDCDKIRLSELIGYERERKAVIDNTVALIDGKHAANALLYGDAGTGKSSTVKAVVNEYSDRGLRLVEVKKSRMLEIPRIVRELSKNPLKFILFIDDLSFSQTNEEIGALKAVLEGSAAARPKNIAIYATSNRRHLIKESFSERAGDDVHLNETLQEQSSLSARFGLAINFSKPNMNEYLGIVTALAEQYGVKNTDRLEKIAEGYALERGGRSGRVARQLIEHLKSTE